MKLLVKKTKYPSIYRLGEYWIDGQDAKEVDWKVSKGGDDPFDGEWVDSFRTKKLAVDFVKSQILDKTEGTKMKSLKDMIIEAESLTESINQEVSKFEDVMKTHLETLLSDAEKNEVDEDEGLQKIFAEIETLMQDFTGKFSELDSMAKKIIKKGK